VLCAAYDGRWCGL